MSESILSRRVSEAQKSRAERRTLMPECAAFTDALREHFPDLRVLYASENGIEWGEKQPEGVKLSDMTPPWFPK